MFHFLSSASCRALPAVRQVRSRFCFKKRCKYNQNIYKRVRLNEFIFKKLKIPLPIFICNTFV